MSFFDVELAEAHVDGGFSHTVVDLVVMVVLVVSGTISIESCLLLVRRCFGEKVVEGRFGRVWEGLSSEVEGSKGLMWEIRMLRNSSSKWATAIWMAELTLLEEAETETEERECSTTLSLSLFIVVEDLDDIGKRRKEEGQQEEDSEPEERNEHTHFKVKIIHIQRQFLRNHL